MKKIANGVNNDIYTQLSQIKKENKLQTERERARESFFEVGKSCTKLDEFSLFFHRRDMVYEILTFNVHLPILNK